MKFQRHRLSCWVLIVTCAMRATAMPATGDVRQDLNQVEIETVTFHLSDSVAAYEGLDKLLEQYIREARASAIGPENLDLDIEETLDIYNGVISSVQGKSLSEDARKNIFSDVSKKYSSIIEKKFADGFDVFILSMSEAIAFEKAGLDIPEFAYNPILGVYQSASSGGVTFSATADARETIDVQAIGKNSITLIVSENETILQFFETRRSRMAMMHWRFVALCVLAESDLRKLIPNSAPAGTRYLFEGLSIEIAYRVLLGLEEDEYASRVLSTASEKLRYSRGYVELRNWPSPWFEIKPRDVSSRILSSDRGTTSFLEMHRFVEASGLKGLHSVLWALSEQGTEEMINSYTIERVIHRETGYDIRSRINRYTISQSLQQAKENYGQVQSNAIRLRMPEVELFCIARVYEAALQEQSSHDAIQISLFYAERSGEAGLGPRTVDANLVAMNILRVFLPRKEETEDAWHQIIPHVLAHAMSFANVQDMPNLVFFANLYGFDHLDNRMEYDFLRAFDALFKEEPDRMHDLIEPLVTQRNTMSQREVAMLDYLVEKIPDEM